MKQVKSHSHTGIASYSPRTTWQDRSIQTTTTSPPRRIQQLTAPVQKQIFIYSKELLFVVLNLLQIMKYEKQANIEIYRVA